MGADVYAGRFITALAAVTINGIAVDPANILPPFGGAPPQDQNIVIIMPSAGLPTGIPMPVVIHTVFGVSNDDQTIQLLGN